MGIDRGHRFDVVVGQDDAEPGLVRSVVVDFELECVVELALKRLRCLCDVDALQSRQCVEQVDGLSGWSLTRGALKVVEFGGLGGAFGFEGVDAAAQPIAEGAVAGVGGFQLGDVPTGVSYCLKFGFAVRGSWWFNE